MDPAEKTLEGHEGETSADPLGRPTDEQQLPFFTTRRLAQTVVVVVLLIVAIYFLLPKLAGLDDATAELGEADPVWIAIAIGFNVLAFATYITLFKGVVGGDVLPLRWREAYEINMAGLAATRLFSAGGAGGIVLTYWALRKAGMGQRQAGCRMVAFLALQYAFYPLALIVFGVLLRTGVLAGPSPVEMTIIPAALGGLAALLGLLIALIPQDFERRIAAFAQGHRRAGLARRLARIPATISTGVRLALSLLSTPSRGGLAVAGALGFWAANVGILWASFKAFGVAIPFGVVVQGFFVGMVANLVPFAPGGVGAVDAGMIGAFVLFDVPHAQVFAAVLSYRLIAFWMPIPPGVIAFFQLRGRVARWEREGRPSQRARAGPATA